MKVAFIRISIVLILLSSNHLFSQNRINSVSINPLNRLRISFEKLPISYLSELSDDKKQITIQINEAFVFLDTNITNQGIINKTVIKANSESCVINLSLNDKRGYTIATLPYSNTFIIDVFQWNSLSSGEDKFRTALIALESKVRESAYDDLISSLKENTKDAAAVLGLELIKDSYIESAKLVLNYAESKGDTSLYELYAGLSDIYNSIGNTTKSNEYSTKFLSLSKSSKLNFLLNTFKNPNDSLFLQKLKFIDSLYNKVEVDSIPIAKNDTNNRIINDSTKKTQTGLDSSIIEYIIYLLLAILLLIIYFYVKWRNNKLQDMINNKKIKIPDNNSDTKTKNDVQKKPINKKLANIYKKNDESLEEKQDKPIVKKIEKSESEKITEQNEKSKTLLDIVRKVQDENKEKEKQDSMHPQQESRSRTQIPAKVEIAMNIANEQKKFKEQSLEEFNTLSLPSDSEKLYEISKKLGIEMGGFEIRKQMEKIMKNDKTMEELKNKFTNRAE